MVLMMCKANHYSWLPSPRSRALHSSLAFCYEVLRAVYGATVDACVEVYDNNLWSSVFMQNRPRNGVLVKISSNRVSTRRYFRPDTLSIQRLLHTSVTCVLAELLKTVTRMQ